MSFACETWDKMPRPLMETAANSPATFSMAWIGAHCVSSSPLKLQQPQAGAGQPPIITT
jgi:hypothetical protein